MNDGPEASVPEVVTDALDLLLRTYPPERTPERTFLGAQYDAGLAWVHQPAGMGGLGVSRAVQPVVDRRLEEAGAPTDVARRQRNTVGHNAVGPLLVLERPDIAAEHLRPIFVGENIWCALLSEPGAGSDLGGLATTARRNEDGDWTVNGQKVWTSSGEIARYGFLLARTDPDVEKYRGLTAFIVDMQAPGVQVRPLRQITGDAEFCEVFLTDVGVPDSNRIGEVGDGWRLAMAFLSFERLAVGGEVPPRGSGPIAEALKLWRSNPSHDPHRRHQLVELWCEAEALRLTNLRLAQSSSAGVPGAGGTAAKLKTGELGKQIHAFCHDLLGPSAMLDCGRSEMSDPRTVQDWFLWSRADTIRGGTPQVLRNGIGEQVLKLPREPRVDRGIAWSEVPRG